MMNEPVYGDPALASRDRRVLRFYERALPGVFRLGKDPASAAIHLGFWDGETRGRREASVNASRALSSRARIGAGERVLDAGSGAGAGAVWLAREIGAEVVGINLSPAQIYASRRLAHRQGVSHLASFERRDFTSTTFPDESFDVVWAVESICHTEKKAKFLAEAARLLKPGGRIAVADRFRTSRDLEAEDEKLLRRWLASWTLPDLPTGAEFVEAARRSGLQNSRLEDATADVWPSLRSLHRRALLGYPAARALRAAGLCDDEQLAAVRAGMDQFEALGRGLWFYGTFTAEKT